MRRSRAAATIAPATGCSLTCSTLAAICSNWLSSTPATGAIAVRRGRPSVSVPVLSMTTVSMRSRSSRASAFRRSTPTSAPRPVPTMMDIGVASPSAHGHAMMRTATAFTSPWTNRGSGPTSAHPTNVRIAITMTAGTNQAETVSARRWMGARDRCASPTSDTMRASSVSAPTRVASITNAPVPFTVPPVTGCPAISTPASPHQ